jgi:branched-chain amino acid transport system permease protein
VTQVVLLEHARSKALLNQAMITLGVGLLLDAMILAVVGVNPVFVPSFSGDNPIRVLSVGIAPQGLWVIGLAALLMLVLWLFHNWTVVGQAMLACSMNQEAAALMGINVGAMIAASWVIAGVIGGIGGASVAPLVGATYGTGLAFALRGFTAVTVGGLGSNIGAVVGGLTVGMASALITGFFGSQAADIATFVILLFVLVARPRGLFGTTDVSGLQAEEAMVT